MGCGASQSHAPPNAVLVPAHKELDYDAVLPSSEHRADDNGFMAAQSERRVVERREVGTNTDEGESEFDQENTQPDSKGRRWRKNQHPGKMLEALCEVAKLKLELKDTYAALVKAERRLADAGLDEESAHIAPNPEQRAPIQTGVRRKLDKQDSIKRLNDLIEELDDENQQQEVT
eukprot:389184-Rhodomonas_salina.2